MTVLQWGSFMQVVHEGEGNESKARSLVADVRRKVADVPPGRFALFHDATRLESANQEYAALFAELMRELPKDRVIQTAAIPKAWMRVLAKTASALGGLDMHIFKTPEEARRFIAQQGIVVPDVTPA